MSVIRIKRRAAGGAVGAPASLENAELAFNEQDSTLYYGVGTGGVGGSATSIITIGGPGAFARLNGSTFTGKVIHSAGTTSIAGGLMLTSGPLKTSPVVGDSGSVEYDGTLTYVINSAGVRKTLAYTDNIPANATNISGGSAGTLLYQTAVNTTAFVAAGLNTQVLIGGVTPSWTNISGLSVATAVNSTQLGGSAAANYALLASPTFTGTVTVPTASFGDNSTAAASTAFVQTAVTNAVQGLDPKASVKAASTANIATLSGPQTIDGVALVAGDRVLVKNQSTPATNGIYVVAAGAWTRSLDMDNWAEVPGAYVFVEEGTTNKDSGFVCSSDVTGTLNTTAITWITFAGAGSVAAGNGISVTGTTVSAVGTANRISISTGIDIASTYVGQTSITTLGTIATGTWNATTIGVTKGGTGLSAAITGLLLGNGTSYAAAVAGTDFLAPSSTIDGGTF
jgi:hypothetical protein